MPSGKKRTHEEFIQLMHVKHPNIEVLGTYKTAHTKIKCKCKIDGYEWEVKPYCLLNGQGCPVCGKIKATKKRTKTHAQFMNDLNKNNKHAKDIEILETYKRDNVKIKCKCKICGHEWKATPSMLLRGSDDGTGTGCPKCAGRIKKTHQQFIVELNQVNDNIEVIGTYKNALIKIKVRCKIDGYEWEATPASLLYGTGCPKCACNIRTHDEFIKDMQIIHADIQVLGTYVKNNKKILCKCKICGHEWEATPSNLLQGSGCPKCNITKGEKRVAQYLDNLDIDYIYDKRYFNDLVSTGGKLLRPDFIIPSLKIWIEYDGIQHFEPKDFSGKRSEQEVQEQFKQTQQHDQIKNQYAQDHNWTLIRIPYWDYDNIEQILDAVLKQEQVI